MAGTEVDGSAVERRVGVNVRQARRAREMSLEDLSSRLTDVGVPISTHGLNRLERGARKVGVDDLMAIAGCLGMTAIELLAPTVLEAQKDRLLAYGNWYADISAYQRVIGIQHQDATVTPNSVRAQAGTAIATANAQHARAATVPPGVHHHVELTDSAPATDSATATVTTAEQLAAQVRLIAERLQITPEELQQAAGSASITRTRTLTVEATATHPGGSVTFAPGAGLPTADDQDGAE
jgi:transcriptional regulator with XRE-family HTH domain